MYYVYLLTCADNTLYCGITTDVDRRVKEHNGSKLGAKYTKPRRPVELSYVIKAKDKSEASKLEYKIKQLSRKEKLELIKTQDKLLNC